MRHSLIARLASALGAAGALALTTACADEPTRPREAAAPTTETRPSLGLAADARGQLRAALLFAGTQSTLALQQRDAADQVTAAFGALAERVDADDATGTDRALAAARQAVKRYRQLASETEGSSGAAVDLAAMDLTLERAAALAAEARGVRDGDQPASSTVISGVMRPRRSRSNR